MSCSAPAGMQGHQTRIETGQLPRVAACLRCKIGVGDLPMTDHAMPADAVAGQNVWLEAVLVMGRYRGEQGQRLMDAAPAQAHCQPQQHALGDGAGCKLPRLLGKPPSSLRMMDMCFVDQRIQHVPVQQVHPRGGLSGTGRRHSSSGARTSSAVTGREDRITGSPVSGASFTGLRISPPPAPAVGSSPRRIRSATV